MERTTVGLPADDPLVTAGRATLAAIDAGPPAGVEARTWNAARLGELTAIARGLLDGAR